MPRITEKYRALVEDVQDAAAIYGELQRLPNPLRKQTMDLFLDLAGGKLDDKQAYATAALIADMLAK